MMRNRERPRSVSSSTTLDWVVSHQISIEYRAIASLAPAQRNARTHSKKQIKQLSASFRQFGFVNPIIIDRGGNIVAGHGRYQAALLFGMEMVPTICIDHLTVEQVRAYRIADNRLAELAGWDKGLLALEIQELIDLEIDFDIEVIGLDGIEIENLISSLDQEPATPAEDEVPEPEPLAVSRPGDLWLLGNHRLLCGDARDPEAFIRLMGGETAQMVFTDSPYNVPIDGHVCGLGKVKHRDFAMAVGEMGEAEFTAFLTTVFGNLVAVSADGSIHFLCMDWRHMREMLSAGRAVYTELKNLCVWNKDNAGMGSFYRSRHELIFVFKHGNAIRGLPGGLLKKVEIAEDGLKITLSLAPLLPPAITTDFQDELTTIRSVPMRIQKRGVEMRLIIPAIALPSKGDPTLVKVIARARAWWRDLETGAMPSIVAIARRDGITEGYVGNLLPLAFLAPSVIEEIIAGIHPASLTAEALVKHIDLPLDWDLQRTVLGCA